MCQIAIAALGAASGAAPSLAQGAAAKSAANAQAAAANTNARLAEHQATDALRRGAHEENKFRREASVLQGSQRAAAAASGVDVDSGSMSDIQIEARMEEEEDAAVIRFNAAREGWGYNTQALDYRNQASAARSAGKNAMTAGMIGAGASLLSLAVPPTGGSAGKVAAAASGKNTSVGETLWGGYDQSELAFLRRKQLAESWNKSHKPGYGGYSF
jgi:hypothetical protein